MYGGEQGTYLRVVECSVEDHALWISLLSDRIKIVTPIMELK